LAEYRQYLILNLGAGEHVAIKQVERVFEKPSLAKRALREITLLRHFSDHENITGLIGMTESNV
jgi:serine/threonine protein kinase